MKSCKSCKWNIMTRRFFHEPSTIIICNRFPTQAENQPSYWCGEYEKKQEDKNNGEAE